MSKIDSRLKKLAIILKESIKLSEVKQTQAENSSVSILWSPHTIDEVLKNHLFYEQPITPPSTMNSDQFLNFLKNKNVPQEIIDKIALINIDYRGFNDQIYPGQIIIHKDLVHSIRKIFKRILLETKFPLTSLFPISMFNENSPSKVNNSGAFEWRFVFNSDEISDHSFGAAIDLNPLINSWKEVHSIKFHKDPRVRKNSVKFCYDSKRRGTLRANSDVVKIFKEEGWKWGGDWENSKDWMHFYRPEIPYKYYGKIEVKE